MNTGLAPPPRDLAFRSSAHFGCVLLALLPWAALAVDLERAGPSPASGASLGTAICQELWRTQIHQFLLAAASWSILGSLLGLLLGLLSIRGARALGWYRSGWKWAGWIRWPLWITIVVCCTSFVGIAGFWQGAIHGSEHVLRKSQIGTAILPEVGNLLADGVASVQACLRDTNAPSLADSNLLERLAAFRAGTAEVNAPEFVQALERVQAATVSNLLANLEQQAMAHGPMLRTGVANQVLHFALTTLGATLAQEKLESELKRLGVAELCQALREKLVAEARRAGNPDTISRPELSAFLVQEGLVPAIMKPIRSFAGGQALLFLVLAIATVVLPPLGFRLTCGRIAAPAPPPAPPLGKSGS